MRLDAEKNHARILELKQAVMRHSILLGQALKRSRDERYFEVLGYETFEAYIDSAHIGLARRSVYSLITIYETFVEELGYSIEELQDVEYSKLDRIVPVIHVQPVAHREWFEKARTLPRRTLEQEVKVVQLQARMNGRLPTPEPPVIKETAGWTDWINTVQCGDCQALLQQLPDACIDCCVTSPPYWSLRDFGVEGQLGLEDAFDAYLARFCDIFDEVRRVLKPTGTCWVNMGDTYTSSPAGNKDICYDGDGVYGRLLKRHSQGGVSELTPKPKEYGNLPMKCLVQTPARFAIEMTDRGWILRNEIIWHKPNAMPSSAKDRFTVDFEKLFFFTKSERYWFETQYEPYTEPLNRWGGPRTKASEHTKGDQFAIQERPERERRPNQEGRNKRCVWTVPTRPYPDAHFAVFPESLIDTPIQAGCPAAVCPACGHGRTRIYAGRSDNAFNVDARDTHRGRFDEKWGATHPARPFHEGYESAWYPEKVPVVCAFKTRSPRANESESLHCVQRGAQLNYLIK